MKRRGFLIIAAGSLVGVVGMGSIIKKLGSSPKAASSGTLNNKLEGIGFSILCGLAATEGRLADKMGAAPFARMEFGQVLIDRIFLNESELIQGRAQKPSATL